MKIKVAVAGDLFPTPINYDLFSKGKPEDIFDEEILEVLRTSDYRICNLEGCFTDEATPKKLKDGPNIRAPKECIAVIERLGIDCVSLANNHATDYGRQGLMDTYTILEKAGIKYFGAGVNDDSVTTHHTATIKGKKITFYGVSETIENVPSNSMPGVNIYDEYRVCNEISVLKSQCDFLVVLYHGGIENIHYNTPSISQRFHRMADCGADIVISQHTHAIGEEEYYGGSYLLYGQGNFCFHYSKELTEWVKTGLLLEVCFEGDSFTISKYIVKRDGPCVRYDKDQNFDGFYDRSRRLTNGDEFNQELRELADKKLLMFLRAFRGKNLLDRIAHRVLSNEKYILYLKKQYSQKHILKILLALQCEEFREVSSQGLYNMLDEMEKKHDR